jgi:hypothetical protein
MFATKGHLGSRFAEQARPDDRRHRIGYGGVRSGRVERMRSCVCRGDLAIRPQDLGQGVDVVEMVSWIAGVR